MDLVEYYFGDPRLALLAVEHLGPNGLSAPLAAALREHRGWSEERIALFDEAFGLYWTRTARLAARASTWSPPRLRHVAVVSDPLSVRPYAPLLNTGAWTLYDADLDPALSHPEFAAYLLVHGDRLAATGEVTMAALRDAAYWFERSDEEIAAFAAAASRSRRLDAEAYRALGAAARWLRELGHETLRPPASASGHRSIPGTGLLVPAALERKPPALVNTWARVARHAVADYHAAWRTPDQPAVAALLDWLAAEAPPLVVTARGGRVLWDAEGASRVGVLRSELRIASGAAVRDVHADLRVLAARTREFYAALARADELPAPPAGVEQTGYTYMHASRRRLAYNVHEPGMERLQGPALPYARAMLGARAAHEWAHLAVAAGWVPRALADGDLGEQCGALAGLLDDAIARSTPQIRRRTADDLDALVAADRALPAPGAGDPRGAVPGRSAGAALVRSLLSRLPDYQANLLAFRFLDPAERETYVRHNVRDLRCLYPPAQLWRMLVRYLYEYQYLGFSAVPDGRGFFLSSTWFAVDFFAGGALDEHRFDELCARVAAICRAHRIDERRILPPS